MSIIRYVLLAISALSATALLAFWTVSGRSIDIVLFITLSFLVLNIFYILISRPTVRTSEILARASTGFALASLELQQQAHDAQAREAEVEKWRQEEAEHNQYKLQVARDMLQLLRPKLSLNKKVEVSMPQLTHRAKPINDTSPQPPPTSLQRGNVQDANGREAEKRPVQSNAQTNTAPLSSSFN